MAIKFFSTTNTNTLKKPVFLLFSLFLLSFMGPIAFFGIIHKLHCTISAIF